MTSDNLPDQESKQELMADDFQISPEFIEENHKLGIIKPWKKKFAPYTKAERMKRRKEVYRLHFELGIPAIRIAEMMKVDKNTINNDIQLLYQELRKDTLTVLDFFDYYNKQITRLESQRSRIMRYLDEAPDVTTRLMIERQLTDIDFRLLASAEKVAHSTFKFYDKVWLEVNKIAEKENLSFRFHSLYEAYKVSDKGHEIIMNVFKKERVTKELDEEELDDEESA